MNASNRSRVAYLCLCIVFAMTGGNAVAGTTSDCSGGGTSTATGTGAIACGYSDYAGATSSSVFGDQNTAKGSESNLFGSLNYTGPAGGQANAFGVGNHATGQVASAFGNRN